MEIKYSCGSNYIDRTINSTKIKVRASSNEDIVNEIDRLKKNKDISHEISMEETLELLDKCGKMWLDPLFLNKHVKILSKITNQSEELVKYELENTMQMLLKENMEKLVELELGSKDILDQWVETSYGYVHRQPRGLLFHNISGNAFVVIPMSISMGLLSKNCNLVKVSADEPYFAYAFYESLCAIDSRVKERLSIIYFNSDESELYETIVKNSDCVVHWGGEYSGRVMSDLCSKYKCHLIMHGAKVSFEVIDNSDNIDSTAKAIGMDMVCWEQKACLSPRIIFVNKNLDYRLLSERLSKWMDEICRTLPKAYLNSWNSIKAIQDRQYCIIKYGMENENKLKVYSSYNADYTVILSNRIPDKEDLDRCLNRFIFIYPYENIDEVYEYVSTNLKDYLQTMGYSGMSNDFIERMTLLGVSIVTKPGEMPMHYPGTSHDGLHNLNEMTFVVSRQV